MPFLCETPIPRESKLTKTCFLYTLSTTLCSFIFHILHLFSTSFTDYFILSIGDILPALKVRHRRNPWMNPSGARHPASTTALATPRGKLWRCSLHRRFIEFHTVSVNGSSHEYQPSSVSITGIISIPVRYAVDTLVITAFADYWTPFVIMRAFTDVVYFLHPFASFALSFFLCSFLVEPELRRGRKPRVCPSNPYTPTSHRCTYRRIYRIGA